MVANQVLPVIRDLKPGEVVNIRRAVDGKWEVVLLLHDPNMSVEAGPRDGSPNRRTVGIGDDLDEALDQIVL